MSLGKFIEEMRKTFVLHAVAAHFSNGVIPVAVLYLLLALPTGSLFFERTVIHLLVIVFLAVPFSFFSGLNDWKTKYKGARTPVFVMKIRLGVALELLVVAAVAIRLSVPDVMTMSGLLYWCYVLLLLAMLPVVVLLGHYGGKLSAGQKSERFR